MSIVISIVKLPESAADTKATHTFAQYGGTIGRGADNEWVIEDPECFISTQHSEISFENGHYYITDLSTNGTFSNGAPDPIGKGNTIKLNDGDKFSLGDYEFLASIWTSEEKEVSHNSGPFSDSSSSNINVEVSQNKVINHNDNNYSSSANPSSLDGYAVGHVSNVDSLFSTEVVETDPLAVLNKSRNIPEYNQFESDVFFGGSQTDQADPMQQSVSWPNSLVESNGIPEDWDVNADNQHSNKANFMLDDGFDNQTVSSNVDKKISLEKANEKILAEIEILKKQAQKQALKEQIRKNKRATHKPKVKSTSSQRASTNNEQSLIDALGLAHNNLSDEKIIEINYVVAELVRETISGMMQVLSSRSTIKNEFRMNVTTIQPVENNPLKFSANIDDAMENMFIKDGNAYKKPVEAIKEGFEGIAEHQVAIIAGIRTAFKGVLTRFDPVLLEQRFEQFNKPGIIPKIGNGKNWESYKNYYQELVDDMDNSFQHLFGYEFVQAYEDQLQKLSVSRKTKVN